MIKTVTALAAVTALLALSACGSDSSPNAGSSPSALSPGATSTKDEDGARQVVQAYLDKFFAADGKGACALFTPKYQQQLVKDSASLGGAQAENCEKAIETGLVASQAFGFKKESTKLTDVTVDGDSATVLGDSTPPFNDTLYQLVWNGSTWLVDSDSSPTPSESASPTPTE